MARSTPRDARAVIGAIADRFTLLGFALSPIYVPNIGGPFGIVASEVLLGLAVSARLLHLLVSGVRPGVLRRQSFLLGLLSVFAVAGLLASLFNHMNLLAFPYIRMMLVSAGSVLLIATFGGEDWSRNQFRLLRGFALGCIVLAFSSLQGPALQGRPVGWSAHPNALGHSCVMGIAACVWMWDQSRTRNSRLFWAGGAAVCLYGVMQSGSRGGLFGLTLGILLYLVLRGNVRLFLAALAATWLAVMLVVTGAVRLPDNNPIVRLVEQEETGSDQSDAARRELLQEDFRVIGDSPVWGGGWDDNERIINVHVVYLQGWVAGGAVSALCLMLLGATMLGLPFLARPRDLALACGATAVAVAWLVTNILAIRDQWLFLAVVFGSMPSIYRLRGAPSRSAPVTASSTAGRSA